MLPRAQLTTRIIQELDQDLDVDAANTAWWYDARPTGGLRLTETGFDVFSDMVGLDHWQFDIESEFLTPRNLLLLDRFMTCPYMLRRQRKQHQLILFGSRESLMASLYNDVEQFISTLKP